MEHDGNAAFLISYPGSNSLAGEPIEELCDTPLDGVFDRDLLSR